MQEELFQQSVANTQLHTVNQNLTAQLAKAEERTNSLEHSVTSLNDERLKVGTSQSQVVIALKGSELVSAWCCCTTPFAGASASMSDDSQLALA